MLTVITGNIFNTKAQVIVNTVNDIGIMGKGIALVFKLRYPLMFDLYQQHCRDKLIEIGKLWLYRAEPNVPWVLNFPTKYHWKDPSKIEYLEKGLQKFVDTHQSQGITSIAFPLLGTHNGGLEKNDVLALMEKYLSRCTIPIEIYEFEPSYPDDLFQLFKERWNKIPYSDLKKMTGIRAQNQVDIINDAVNSTTVSSLITLIEFDGIGLKTMEKCFSLVMKNDSRFTLFE